MENEILDKAVKKGENSALAALVLWLCAVVGAFCLKCLLSFIKWAFQK